MIISAKHPRFTPTTICYRKRKVQHLFRGRTPPPYPTPICFRALVVNLEDMSNLSFCPNCKNPKGEIYTRTVSDRTIRYIFECGLRLTSITSLLPSQACSKRYTPFRITIAIVKRTCITMLRVVPICHGLKVHHGPQSVWKRHISAPVSFNCYLSYSRLAASPASSPLTFAFDIVIGSILSSESQS